MEVLGVGPELGPNRRILFSFEKKWKIMKPGFLENNIIILGDFAVRIIF
jgi:hypothetical protein